MGYGAAFSMHQHRAFVLQNPTVSVTTKPARFLLASKEEAKLGLTDSKWKKERDDVNELSRSRISIEWCEAFDKALYLSTVSAFIAADHSLCSKAAR
jgi:hypothetical protein